MYTYFANILMLFQFSSMRVFAKVEKLDIIKMHGSNAQNSRELHGRYDDVFRSMWYVCMPDGGADVLIRSRICHDRFRSATIVLLPCTAACCGNEGGVLM